MAKPEKYVCNLDEALKEKAEQELLETDANRSHKIEELRTKVLANKGE